MELDISTWFRKKAAPAPAAASNNMNGSKSMSISLLQKHQKYQRNISRKALLPLLFNTNTSITIMRTIIIITCLVPSVDRGVVGQGEVVAGSAELRFRSQCTELHLQNHMSRLRRDIHFNIHIIIFFSSRSYILEPLMPLMWYAYLLLVHIHFIIGSLNIEHSMISMLKVDSNHLTPRGRTSHQKHLKIGPRKMAMTILLTQVRGPPGDLKVFDPVLISLDTSWQVLKVR